MLLSRIAKASADSFTSLGPTALTGHGQARGHVGLVEIRAHFAVNFNANPPGIEDFRDFRIVKNFVGHNMAPVAGSVANRYQQPFALGCSPLQEFGTPLIPVNGLVGVLLQVVTWRSVKAIHSGLRYIARQPGCFLTSS
jgi:hypothetical protein